MPHFYWPPTRWFSRALCCRYLAVRFSKLQVLMLSDGAPSIAEWHWAMGFFTEGQFEVFGAWPHEGMGTGQRIASNLYNRGIERIKALAVGDDLIAEMACLRPAVCRNSTAELIDSGAFGPRMQRVIQWTAAAGEHMQGRMSRAVKRQPSFANPTEVACYLAQAFQRADRDVLHDCWDRKQPTPFGRAAFIASLARG